VVCVTGVGRARCQWRSFTGWVAQETWNYWLSLCSWLSVSQVLPSLVGVWNAVSGGCEAWVCGTLLGPEATHASVCLWTGLHGIKPLRFSW
jgi:hypothetical protein